MPPSPPRPKLVWASQDEGMVPGAAHLLETNESDNTCLNQWASDGTIECVPQKSVSAAPSCPAVIEKRDDKNHGSSSMIVDETQIPAAASAKRKRSEPVAATKPTVKFVKGGARTKEDGQRWLKETRLKIEREEKELAEARKLAGQQRKRTSKQEHYPGEGNFGARMLPPHTYKSVQFCDKNLLPDQCTGIKVLANAEFQKTLDVCHDFDDFLGRRAKETCETIKKVPEFQHTAIRSMVSATEQNAWLEKLESLDTMQSITELQEENQEGLKDPFKYTTRAASLHEQTEQTATQVSAYYSHKDKVGNIVCFYPLSGVSYNFVAMPSKGKTKPMNGKKEKAEFERNCGSHQQYEAYKAASDADRDMIEKFEADFLKRATSEALPRVRVYKMEASDKLIFTAADYLHGTIIPKQQDGIQRALLVFHDLIPYETFEY